MAYQPGKAANVAPPATISHTSLPSHTGPIVLIKTRLSVSSLARNGSSVPTPKSNPSSTKYPIHRIAISANQNVWRCQ